jgi:HSP20 family protein
VKPQGKIWRPPTDVYETDSAVVVRIEIAGMGEDGFDIQLVRRTLVVTGRRQDSAGTAKLAYQRMEIMYGEFRSEVYLPWPISETAIEANYQDGFLVITLPKARVHKVPILNAAGADDSDEAA